MRDSPKKKSGLFRVILLIAVIALAVIIVAIAASRHDGGLRGLWNAVTGNDDAEEFYYESSTGGSFRTIGGKGLAVMSQAGLYVFDASGDERFSTLFAYSSPAMRVAGDYGAACDIGGNSVIFFNTDEIISHIETEYPVISATVNDSGYLCVCTEESGYMGSVTVYNPNGTDIYKWYSGSGRILSACVNGNSDLMVLTVGSGGSNLVLMPLNSDQETARFTDEGLIIDAGFSGNGVWALTTDSVIFLNRDMSESAVYDMAGRYLKGYSVVDGRMLLMLSDYQVGGTNWVISVGTDGQEIGSAQLASDPAAMDAFGDRLTILYTDKIEFYNTDMTKIGESPCEPGTESISMREDGSVLAAGSFSAQVMVPAEEG